MKYIPPKKLKVIMMMFFVGGIWGIMFGLYEKFFYITLFGTINLCLGGVFGYRLLTQGEPSAEKKRKKQRNDH
jgi:hypothetical protein